MSAAHTPTPWHSEESAYEKRGVDLSAMKPVLQACSIWQNEDAGDTLRRTIVCQRGFFIVRACNAHHDLVAVLKCARLKHSILPRVFVSAIRIATG